MWLAGARERLCVVWVLCVRLANGLSVRGKFMQINIANRVSNCEWNIQICCRLSFKSNWSSYIWIAAHSLTAAFHRGTCDVRAALRMRWNAFAVVGLCVYTVHGIVKLPINANSSAYSHFRHQNINCCQSILLHQVEGGNSLFGICKCQNSFVKWYLPPLTTHGPRLQ